MSTDVRFTASEILGAEPCVHSVRDLECASCVRHIVWYEGRIAGLREVTELLARNSAVADAMRDTLANREPVRDPTIMSSKEHR